MLTCIAPVMSGYQNTYNALNFASKSRNIVNEPLVKEVSVRPAKTLPEAPGRTAAAKEAMQATLKSAAAATAQRPSSGKQRLPAAPNAGVHDAALLKRVRELEEHCTELALQQAMAEQSTKMYAGAPISSAMTPGSKATMVK